MPAAKALEEEEDEEEDIDSNKRANLNNKRRGLDQTRATCVARDRKSVAHL